jgi:putative secretion ATPase (PEP-CTERM system associated)
MYEVFYNLTAEPFRLSPDHKFCYEHKGYAKARAYMAYAFTQAEGFVMITGRPGTGKTTLIGELVETLARDNVQTASLVCTQLAADDLLKSVAYSFGIEAENVDKAELLHKLSVLFQRLHREGRRALLIVDEAQDLSVSAMEELRLLTNIQMSGQPLLQIFLLGQPELRDVVLSPQMEQVHQRIVAASHLEGLEVEEVEGYVLHRLKKVGWAGDPAINRAIFPLIHKFSEGVPRRVNLICSRLLLHGCVESRHEIDVPDLRLVIEELQSENLAAGVRPGREDFAVAGRKDWAGASSQVESDSPDPQDQPEVAEQPEQTPQPEQVQPQSRPSRESPPGARLRAVSESPASANKTDQDAESPGRKPTAQRVEPTRLASAPEPVLVKPGNANESVAEDIAEDIVERVVEPVEEPIAEPIAEQEAEPEAESLSASVPDPVLEPAVEPIEESVEETVEEPKTESKAEPKAGLKTGPKVEEVKARPSSAESGEQRPAVHEVKRRKKQAGRPRPMPSAPASARKPGVAGAESPGSTAPPSQGVAQRPSKTAHQATENPPAALADTKTKPAPSAAVASKVPRASIPPAIIAGLVVAVLALLAIFLLPLVEEKYQWTSEGLPKASPVSSLEPSGAPSDEVADILPGDVAAASEVESETTSQDDVLLQEIDNLYAQSEPITEAAGIEEVAIDVVAPALQEAEVGDAAPAVQELEQTASTVNALPAATNADEVVADEVVESQETERQSVPELVASAPVSTLERELLLLVSFPFNSAELTADVLASLEEAGKLLSDNTASRAVITGFTDQSGDPVYNLDLSWNRARAVEEYFVRMGIEPARLKIEGRGGVSDPLNGSSSESTGKGDRYRIVQVKIIPGHRP